MIAKLKAHKLGESLPLDENTAQVRERELNSNSSQQDATAFCGAAGEEFSVTSKHEFLFT